MYACKETGRKVQFLRQSSTDNKAIHRRGGGKQGAGPGLQGSSGCCPCSAGTQEVSVIIINVWHEKATNYQATRSFDTIRIHVRS
jgi:hypothetical protein